MLAVLHNSLNSPYFPVLIILIFVCVFIGLQMYTPGLNSIKSQKVGDFLTSLTLLSSYMKSRVTNGAVSCKKKDVLNLTLVEYKKYADSLTEGFMEAEKLLQEERIFVDDDVPYSTQLIPLSAICAAQFFSYSLRGEDDPKKKGTTGLGAIQLIATELKKLTSVSFSVVYSLFIT